jgi:hypothetical protein
MSVLTVLNEIIGDEKQTISNQFKALTAHDLSASPATARPDARVQHVVV